MAELGCHRTTMAQLAERGRVAEAAMATEALSFHQFCVNVDDAPGAAIIG